MARALVTMPSGASGNGGPVLEPWVLGAVTLVGSDFEGTAARRGNQRFHRPTVHAEHLHPCQRMTKDDAVFEPSVEADDRRGSVTFEGTARDRSLAKRLLRIDGDHTRQLEHERTTRLEHAQEFPDIQLTTGGVRC